MGEGGGGGGGWANPAAANARRLHSLLGNSSTPCPTTHKRIEVEVFQVHWFKPRDDRENVVCSCLQ